MKKENTISYKKTWSPKTGSCYTQTVNITNDNFMKLCDCLQAERANHNSNLTHYQKSFLSVPLERVKSIIFMNLTQRDFFNNYLKLKLLDRNTCFCIID